MVRKIIKAAPLSAPEENDSFQYFPSRILETFYASLEWDSKVWKVLLIVIRPQKSYITIARFMSNSLISGKLDNQNVSLNGSLLAQVPAEGAGFDFRNFETPVLSCANRHYYGDASNPPQCPFQKGKRIPSS